MSYYDKIQKCKAKYLAFKKKELEGGTKYLAKIMATANVPVKQAPVPLLTPE